LAEGTPPDLTMRWRFAPMMRLARFYGVMVAISGLALGAMGQAAAASVTHTMDINTLTQPGFIPQFNPDLGTLLEVDFSATGSASAIIHVDPPVYAAVIPEPPSAVMAGIASLAGLGYWLRRRKRVYGEHASEIVSQCTNVVYFRQADVESAN